ncbi:hypothetical protein NDN08_004590 [Rhodosorus marinus]|uniref:Large ribosomal subunit protein uL22c n=1 Tax=Rhodosorus marinus TaxID=101924 RepID=A0AAV8ULP3_9RHOD|nr:hypothetical protein NDN08_004590 [Rhodosorus marinus]
MALRLLSNRSGLFSRSRGWGCLSRRFASDKPEARTNPFDIDESVYEKVGGDEKKKDDEENLFRKGWGKDEKNVPQPPHQRGCVRHSIYHIRISPRKLNQFCTIIRGRSIEQARAQLTVSVLRPARVVEMCLREALNKAEDAGWNMKRIRIAELYVGRGIRVKQLRPWHGRGRFGIGTKYRAHLTIVLRKIRKPSYDALHPPLKPRGEGKPAPKEYRLKPRPHLPKGDFMPKPWLLRSQLDVTAQG